MCHLRFVRPVFSPPFDIFSILLLLSCLGFGDSLSADGIALLEFKGDVTADPLNLLGGWNPADETPCSWYGVSCDNVSGRVTSLNITGGSWFSSTTLPSQFSPSAGRNSSLLTGSLKAAIWNLTALRMLALPYNEFSGEIPPEIDRLIALEVLELQGNNFSGLIPNQISHLLHLKVLNLAYNSFSGKIPASIVQFANLTHMNLKGNFLNGNLPEKLIGFSRIESIDLSYNQLSGQITEKNLGRCESLRRLHLSNNFFVNRIPREIAICSQLRSLLLSGNIFEGTIPAEIGSLSDLRVLDVSRNSLIGRVPEELGDCKRLSVIVLTDVMDIPPLESRLVHRYLPVTFRGEFNAFDGGIPIGVFLLPGLKIFWAPRANLNGRLPVYWIDSCELRILNLGLNYIGGFLPEGLSKCRKMTWVDLSSNGFYGQIPASLAVKCMFYFNVSGNSLSGTIPEFAETVCDGSAGLRYVDPSRGRSGDPANLFKVDDDYLEYLYSVVLSQSQSITNPTYASKNGSVVIHDFGWNNFTGSLHFSSLSAVILLDKPSYVLLLNNNQFNGCLPGSLIDICKDLESFTLHIGFNQISGEIPDGIFLSCPQMVDFSAAYDQLSGGIPAGIGRWFSLSNLDLSGNRLSGAIPDQLVTLGSLRSLLLRGNGLIGEIPVQFAQSSSILRLDISNNSLTGVIPAALGNASNLRALLLDHNQLTGEIPLSFSMLYNLTELDLSYNNLSGYIPTLQHPISCDHFMGNIYLHPCTDLVPPPRPYEPSISPPDNDGNGARYKNLKADIVGLISLSSAILSAIVVLILVLYLGKKGYFKLIRSHRRKLVVVFSNACVDLLTYENVVRATGNFSVANLIGTGGFGGTYKAELAPGFLVAVKRLSFGRFQGMKQFDAEIRTLGQIQHENLVTLIGYHVGGEKETFLVYNYLSGGNLDSFIHKRWKKKLRWPFIRKIALDVADALVYLHYDCDPHIVHRDVKPSNILLDDELNAYLSDFGLARLLEASQTHATTDVAGTFGYVAPEYATTCRVSNKADVYSFGVVLMEMLSGKRALDPSFCDYGNGFNIVAWGDMLLKEDRLSEFFIPGLWEAGPQEKLVGMLKIASMCTVELLTLRPSMKQVFQRLKRL